MVDRAPVCESRAAQYGEQAGRRGLRAADADRPRRKSEALPDHAALRDVVPGELAPEISESSSSTFRHGDGDHLSQQADNTVQVVQLVARKEPA